MNLDSYRAESLATWAEMAPGWEGRREWLMGISAPVNDWLLGAVDPQEGESVLELAAGTGDLGFAIAERVGPDGRVISSDFAPEMVDVARRVGAERELGNVRYEVIDAERIDLPDDHVDAVVCRWGYMLMSDPAAALAETRRVLKPGGRLAFAVAPGFDEMDFELVADAAQRVDRAFVGNEGVDLRQVADAYRRGALELGRVGDEDDVAGIGDDRLRDPASPPDVLLAAGLHRGCQDEPAGRTPAGGLGEDRRAGGGSGSARRVRVRHRAEPHGRYREDPDSRRPRAETADCPAGGVMRGASLGQLPAVTSGSNGPCHPLAGAIPVWPSTRRVVIIQEGLAAGPW